MLYPFGPKSQDAKAQYKNFVRKAQKEDPPEGKNRRVSGRIIRPLT